ncbi:hypothetical protein FNF27_03414 [Cafeteria roenbergensis]|uniref:PPM-type phosphatase domain-containing protein n=2 Tax=Cafeteria roenbergensis TaxID=33653 RepID=A0A5A8DV50_CAFRO|nr:hypothetical protein FNF29_06759 [Cafeteria roenbergensis]KAA0169286.1 hypothetical protein FNF28_02240 [Cafeteria roenbergensis]KAA0175116.1 hypothetical protein FNF27_03414 [Cafeteria roenbergensis]|eukprot:KAA0148372.1 hypothetical protein FNF29_06759 [Cafeteria roenbergensis]
MASASEAPSAAAAASTAPSSTEPSTGPAIRTSHRLGKIGRLELSTCTKIGRRKTQEDRLVVCPKMLGREDVSLFCVFDGTVGDHAAAFCHDKFPGILVKRPSFAAAVEAMDGGDVAATKTKLAAALQEAFAQTDAELIESCKADKVLDYVSSTGVVAVLMGKVLSIAHVGDSRVAVGHMVDGSLRGGNMTIDHKPDKPAELRRIEAAGGSLTYLHGGKPFIRGGDFTARQARGDRPMQLNYSRAFGGKDLKPYGLSCQPSISHVDVTASEKMVILASDGLWDVISADSAVGAAQAAASSGAASDPAEHLVDSALAAHDAAGSVDNVTVVVAFF